MKKKTCAVVGAGARGLGMFAKPLLTDHADTAKLVGCEVNASLAGGLPVDAQALLKADWRAP